MSLFSNYFSLWFYRGSRLNTRWEFFVDAWISPVSSFSSLPFFLRPSYNALKNFLVAKKWKFFTIIVLSGQLCNLEAEAHIMDKKPKVWVLCENSFFSNYMGFRLNYPPVRNGVPPTPRAKSGLICVFHAVQITTTTNRLMTPDGCRFQLAVKVFLWLRHLR